MSTDTDCLDRRIQILKVNEVSFGQFIDEKVRVRNN